MMVAFHSTGRAHRQQEIRAARIAKHGLRLYRSRARRLQR
jgi:hypothetical protein